MGYKLVMVEWDDANSGIGWLRVGDQDRDLPEPSACKTVGWLIKEEIAGIVIAGTLGAPSGQDKGHEFNQVIAIPMGMVTNLEVLQE